MSEPKKKFSLFSLFVIFLIIGGLWGIISPDDDKKNSNNNSKSTTTTSTPKPSKYGDVGDEDKYYACYGDMTKLYKANGLHERNRSASIEAKETICRAYSRGEQSSYPKL